MFLESGEDSGLATQKSTETGHMLSERLDLLEELLHVITSSSVHLVFDLVYTLFYFGNGREERIDDIVPWSWLVIALQTLGQFLHKGIEDPIAINRNVILQKLDALQDLIWVLTFGI